MKILRWCCGPGGWSCRFRCSERVCRNWSLSCPGGRPLVFPWKLQRSSHCDSRVKEYSVCVCVCLCVCVRVCVQKWQEVHTQWCSGGEQNWHQLSSFPSTHRTSHCSTMWQGFSPQRLLTRHEPILPLHNYFEILNDASSSLTLLACYLLPDCVRFSYYSVVVPTFNVGHFVSAKLYRGIIN